MSRFTKHKHCGMRIAAELVRVNNICLFNSLILGQQRDSGFSLTAPSLLPKPVCSLSSVLQQEKLIFKLTDWTLLSASSVFNATSSTGRDALIGMVHSRSSWQSGMTPNPATYSPIDGNVTRGPASPAMGAIYSLLALS